MNRLTLSSLVCSIAIQWTIMVTQLGMIANPSMKWDLVSYVIFVMCALIGGKVAGTVFKEPMQDANWWRRVGGYWCVEMVLTVLMISAVFKATIYDNSPLLAGRALTVLLALAVVCKLCWTRLVWIAGKWDRGVDRLSTKSQDVLALVAIVLLVLVPDVSAVMAESFIGEQWHHWDYFVMSPGWASLMGHLPYVEVISQYGVGVPIVLSKLAVLFGGFDYVPMLRLVMVLVMAYYLGFYVLVRVWLGRPVLAVIAFLLLFRLNMFHPGINPLAWIYPSTTPVRFGIDILWLGLLLMHIRTQRPLWLVAAAVCSGAELFWMTSTGLCVMAAFYFYLGLRLWDRSLGIGPAVVYGALPVLSAGVLFVLALGQHAFEITFWQRWLEYMTFFAHGHAGGVLPFYENLKYRHYWAQAMSVILPLVYLATLLWSAGRWYLDRGRREDVWVMVVAVYGLAHFQYFVVRSVLTSYYVSALPFVLLCCFWFVVWIKSLPMVWQKRCLAAAFWLSLYALVTNHNFLSYPNLFNVSKNPTVDPVVAQHHPDRQGYFHHQVKFMREEDKVPLNALGEVNEDIRTEESFKTDRELVEYFRREADFSEDARLIASLTSPQEPVALISSFETKILMQAQRAPLFYHFPWLTSMPMRTRAFPSDAAHSPNFLKDTLAQLKTQNPAFVFVENVFLQDQVPAAYTNSHATVLAVLDYVRRHYVLHSKGRYLTALQRRP